jgi:hypothetical protein
MNEAGKATRFVPKYDKFDTHTEVESFLVFSYRLNSTEGRTSVSRSWIKS